MRGSLSCLTVSIFLTLCCQINQRVAKQIIQIFTTHGEEINAAGISRAKIADSPPLVYTELLAHLLRFLFCRIIS
jgi:hypothetical protein